MFSARMIYTAARVSKVPGSIIMKSLTRILLLLAIVGPASAGTYTPDFERGRALSRDTASIAILPTFIRGRSGSPSRAMSWPAS